MNISLELDDDLRVGPIGSFSDLPPPTASPLASNSASSIAPASTKPVSEPLKPKLSPPRHFMLGVIDLHNALEGVTQQCIDQMGEQMRADLKELEHLSEERAAALEQHAREVASQQTWGVWVTIGQYLASAASLILGIGLISTQVGATAGYFLIASGGLGLANRVMNDVGAWSAVAKYFVKSQEMQQKVAQWIDIGVFFLSVGLGLAGGVMAWQSGAFALTRDEVVTKTGQIVALAGTVLGIGARFGQSLAERRAFQLQAQLKKIEGKQFSLRQDLSQCTSDARKTIEMTESASKETVRLIQSSEVHIGN
jgi:cob(I)alamin adenosyltransferase